MFDVNHAGAQEPDFLKKPLVYHTNDGRYMSTRKLFNMLGKVG